MGLVPMGLIVWEIMLERIVFFFGMGCLDLVIYHIERNAQIFIRLT